MKKQLNNVEEFQKAFNRPVKQKLSLIPVDASELRFKLLEEENLEYREACETDDLIGIADALADQLYIIFGTILEHGMQHIITPVFEEVHRSNMSKLDINGKPVLNGFNGVFEEDKPIGKILKSRNFTSPNIKQFI